MATKFYFHAAASPTYGGTLPSTLQYSDQTVSEYFDAYTVNRSMDTTKGTSQASIAKSTSGGGSPRYMYVTRFVSAPIATQTVSAATWTLWEATASPGGFSWPGGYSNGYREIAIYVWRPSTGARVGFIRNGISADFSNNIGSTSETTGKTTYSGSAVSATSGDVICVEIIGATDSASGTNTYTWYFDGTTIPSTDDTSIASCASSIGTTQTLTFAPTSTACTVTSKVVTNKFIIKH